MATSYGVEELHKGLKIKIDGKPHAVTEFSFMKPGKGQAVYKCRVKNLITGNTYEKSYRSGESFEKADVAYRKVNFSYIDAGDYVFIDSNSYEEIRLNDDIVGKSKNFLEDDMECEIVLFEDSAIELSLENFVIKEITYTEPGVKGDTANNVTKPAQIDTGYEIHVPLFINLGDNVKIDTRTGLYLERVNLKK